MASLFRLLFIAPVAVIVILLAMANRAPVQLSFDPVSADGAYTFTVGPGDMDEIQMRSVDLVLRGGVGAYDERVQPFGFVLSAVGFIGLVIALRRAKGGGRPQNPNSQPPPPKWGRGGV